MIEEEPLVAVGQTAVALSVKRCSLVGESPLGNVPHAFVGGIVVVVAHAYDVGRRVFSQEGIGNAAVHLGGGQPMPGHLLCLPVQVSIWLFAIQEVEKPPMTALLKSMISVSTIGLRGFVREIKYRKPIRFLVCFWDCCASLPWGGFSCAI